MGCFSETDLNPSNSNNVLLVYGWNDSDGVLNNDYSRDKNSQCHTAVNRQQKVE